MSVILSVMCLMGHLCEMKLNWENCVYVNGKHNTPENSEINWHYNIPIDRYYINIDGLHLI